ncbi:RNA transcription, translation and transport factor protein [Anoplophora glabripennis]|uniref:RNA transcription, translation and transport factor protein n=1 Tax=Anoplophora glabripennis TaxID=217634 RepID=UPI0008750B2E|nr:RNA transcription, translation and transport factor protein [Anoplophora glabripennis]
MSKRLLNALEYPQADSLNLNDPITFKKIVVWLETNRIKRAPPNIFNALKNINGGDWDNVFIKYKDGLGCPVLETKLEELQWLLGYAVQIATSANRNLYLKYAVENIQTTNAPTVVAENPLDKLDFRSKEFANGINELAKILKVVPHPDPLITLRAVRKVITNRMAPDRVENPQKYIVEGTPFPFQEADLGFDLNDPVLNNAAKILRMLYIHDVRDLQTKANELIVAAQSVTANPKTDTRLGKVGF